MLNISMIMNKVTVKILHFMNGIWFCLPPIQPYTKIFLDDYTWYEHIHIIKRQKLASSRLMFLQFSFLYSQWLYIESDLKFQNTTFQLKLPITHGKKRTASISTHGRLALNLYVIFVFNGILLQAVENEIFLI